MLCYVIIPAWPRARQRRRVVFLGTNSPCPHVGRCLLWRQINHHLDGAMENCTPKTKKRTRTEADEMQCKRRKCHWKHDGFVSEPMGDKDVTKLPGISKANGCKLRHLGCHSAYIVWAKFLVLGKDPVLFQCWLHDMTDASLPDTQACCDCLMEYTLVFGVCSQA